MQHPDLSVTGRVLHAPIVKPGQPLTVTQTGTRIERIARVLVQDSSKAGRSKRLRLESPDDSRRRSPQPAQLISSSSAPLASHPSFEPHLPEPHVKRSRLSDPDDLLIPGASQSSSVVEGPFVSPFSSPLTSASISEPFSTTSSRFKTPENHTSTPIHPSSFSESFGPPEEDVNSLCDTLNDASESISDPATTSATVAVLSTLGSAIPWDDLPRAQQESFEAKCREIVDPVRDGGDPYLKSIRWGTWYQFLCISGLHYTHNDKEALDLLDEFPELSSLIIQLRHELALANFQVSSDVVQTYWRIMNHGMLISVSSSASVVTLLSAAWRNRTMIPGTPKKEEYPIIMKWLDHALTVTFQPLFDLVRSDERISSRFGLRTGCVTTAMLDDLHSPSAALSEQVRRIFVRHQNSCVQVGLICY